MRVLKITLCIAVLFASLTSCTKEDLNEDDVLTVEELYAGEEEQTAPPTGGGTNEGDGSGD